MEIYDIKIKNLTFNYPNTEKLFSNLSLNIKKGERCLLVGSNGSGKTTLLNILGGKHMINVDSVLVLNQPSFHNTHPKITLLTGNWSKTVSFAGTNVAYQSDITVLQMLKELKNYDINRLKKLLSVLDINLSWRMHLVSDGQRRRVQILLGLIQPCDVLLLDEITVDLDLVSRNNFLNFLKEESENNNLTILYATHIFDRLDEWATNIAYINDKHSIGEYDYIYNLKNKYNINNLSKLIDYLLRIEKKYYYNIYIVNKKIEFILKNGTKKFEQQKIIKKYADNKYNSFNKDYHNYW